MSHFATLHAKTIREPAPTEKPSEKSLQKEVNNALDGRVEISPMTPGEELAVWAILHDRYKRALGKTTLHGREFDITDSAMGPVPLGGNRPFGSTPGDFKEIIEAEDSKSSILVARPKEGVLNGKPVGFVIFGKSDDGENMIKKIATSKAGSENYAGLGSELLKRAMHELGVGTGPIVTYIPEGNTAAHDFFERYGFSKVPFENNGYAMGPTFVRTDRLEHPNPIPAKLADRTHKLRGLLNLVR